jgi:hypothetical protein
VNFFSVSYFDQIEDVWYLLLALIAGATAEVLREDPAPGGAHHSEGGDFYANDFQQPA